MDGSSDFSLDGLLARGIDDTRAPPMFSSPHRPDAPRSSCERLVFPFPSSSSSSVSSSFDHLPPFRLMPPSPCFEQSLPLSATTDAGSAIDPFTVALPPQSALDDFDFDPYLRSGEMPIAGGPPWQPRRRAMSDDSQLFSSIGFPLFDETLPEPESELDPCPHPTLPPRLRSSSAPVPSTILWPASQPKLGRPPSTALVPPPPIIEETWFDDALTESSFSSSYGHSRAASVVSDATSVAEGPPMRMTVGPDGRKLWQCLEPGCDKAFHRRPHLERHATSLHAKARRACQGCLDAADPAAFACEVEGCDKTFARDDNRRYVCGL